MWCTCPAGYTGAFCQKKGKSKHNENIILHGILAVIAWDFSLDVNYHISDRTNNGEMGMACFEWSGFSWAIN